MNRCKKTQPTKDVYNSCLSFFLLLLLLPTNPRPVQSVLGRRRFPSGLPRHHLHVSLLRRRVQRPGVPARGAVHLDGLAWCFWARSKRRVKTGLSFQNKGKMEAWGWFGKKQKKIPFKTKNSFLVVPSCGSV